MQPWTDSLRFVSDLVLLPWADHATALGDATRGLNVVVFDKDDPAPSQEMLDQVVFYVAPYEGGRRCLALIPLMPRVQIVQSLWAGVDGVWPFIRDDESFPLTLCNAAGVHDASTAELAVALTLARLRELDVFARVASEGAWLHETTGALADRTVLILGYGNIGRATEQRLAGFEVEIIRVAQTARVDEQGRVIHAQSELADLIPQADVVIVTMPQTADTTGLIDADFLARMKDGSLLVNVARGVIVVTDDLLAELRTGRISAALDVTDPEPLPPGHPLWTAPGVLISPHVGGSTTAFLPRAQRLVTDQLRRWKAGEPLANVIARPVGL
jgi:phosphoglycerate dehydrogenase-like enzyme